MDVCMRAKQFFGTLHRDALKHGITNVVIVSHGVTIRAIIAMWLHKSPQWFEDSLNPTNCRFKKYVFRHYSVANEKEMFVLQHASAR